ncbi:multidrug effflux MFS transporter [Sphingomonas japonica]|uniref:Bcr/CflA family efflux transporter n=1 Tax=Sphingomonas japonica TaxID=511662 RepID=A0ABX0U239_9SPHN|nr:multidrug effflux MFS transporter [Sphingomonas japonica]NIJ23426.1 DHA1 family bicyclomycin/chloramphenicol resistance-like MFS transporter [Sphingomonas japonica]
MDQMTRVAADRAPLPFTEFVALCAALMALTALGIDSMLPALPAIAEALGVTVANDRQYVITAFLVGFAIAQLAHGPLSDRFGRRPVLIGALLFAVAANLAAAAAESFALLLAARFAGGMAVAGARVVTVAMVRDCFSGRAMARVMSLVFMVFMAAPVLAPSFGQLVLLVAPWRWIFIGIAIVSAAVLVWFMLRMPETLAPEDQHPFRFARLAQGYRTVLGDRCSAGYTLAAALLSGGLFGFINSIQQIMEVVFGRPELLSVIFICVAGLMAVANYSNSRIVMRFGMRLLSHSALAALIVIAAVHLIVALAGVESLVVFAVLQAMMMACFGLATSNFSAMAMSNMGHIAGTASSVQGFVSTLGGALIGAGIGQAFDGSTVPLYAGFLICGLIALAIVAVVERGRLFRAS